MMPSRGRAWSTRDAIPKTARRRLLQTRRAYSQETARADLVRTAPKRDSLTPSLSQECTRRNARCLADSGAVQTWAAGNAEMILPNLKAEQRAISRSWIGSTTMFRAVLDTQPQVRLQMMGGRQGQCRMALCCPVSRRSWLRGISHPCPSSRVL